MEKREIVQTYRLAFYVFVLAAIGGLSFAAGLLWSMSPQKVFVSGIRSAHAAESGNQKRSPRVVYPRKTDLDFDGMNIEGEIQRPGEFYFQHRTQEKFDSLVQRRKNFHREMLRDAVLSK